ncbi:hypothetical protein N656DRAFT_794327 [Canariomyces notabilis]|uniref:DUF7735 domain-containing protein n=1 Tax=Canariomyces notabilis TaxID=2074819 RepID=A0AAN6YXN3_9PEZI|nr:hypothetical protein N656DRAFT_794327 [Canariomyces arenarius]
MKRTTNTLGLLALVSTALAAETHITAAEWAVPTQTNDPYQCATRDIPHYLTAGPSPSGALSSALLSYEENLYETCTRATSGPFQPCPVPPRSQLCAFSTAVPTSLLPAYSSYASSAASWWSAGNGDVVVSLVQECPYLWYDSLLMNPASGSNLNRTVAHAQCWAEAHPTGSESGGLTTLSATGTSTASQAGVAGSTATPTGNGGVRGRTGVGDGSSWMMAGSGMGMAAAMNVGLL